ncbi:hypothetical protein B0H17DRAFT_1129182 [Mycena rosella]|uniref:Uncharacterized protein n=1 Tax=Mycena rosella TaxID=1033263 RepID=A0AAD7GQA7_MYCRO|nr:hypothetical protein B0H17DRAFT_1129182 [Mycena rosella]
MTFPQVDGWLDVLASAASFARLHRYEWPNINYYSDYIKTLDMKWIGMVLEHLKQLYGDNPDSWDTQRTLMTEVNDSPEGNQIKPITRKCRGTSSSPLRTSLVNASHKAKGRTIDANMSSHNKQVLNSPAELLEALHELIQTDPSSGEVDIGGERKTYQDWTFTTVQPAVVSRIKYDTPLGSRVANEVEGWVLAIRVLSDAWATSGYWAAVSSFKLREPMTKCRFAVAAAANCRCYGGIAAAQLWLLLLHGLTAAALPQQCQRIFKFEMRPLAHSSICIVYGPEEESASINL